VAGTKLVVDDDTPKTFQRLLKRKSRKDLIAEGKLEAPKQNTLKIQPGESFADFRRFAYMEIAVMVDVSMLRSP